MSALVGGGAPAAFRRACRNRTEGLLAVAAAVDSTCRAHRGAPTLLEGPLLGQALTDVTGFTPPDDQPVEQQPRPQRPWLSRRAPASPPRPHTDGAPRAAWHPQPVPQPHLRPRRPAGAVTGPERPPAQRTVTGRLPGPDCRVDPGLLRRLAGALPDSTAPRDRLPAPAHTPRAGNTPDRPADGRSVLRAAAQAVAGRLGVAPEAVHATGGTVPRPGPMAPGHLLRRAPGGDDRAAPAARAPILGSPPDQNHTEATPPSRATGHSTASIADPPGHRLAGHERPADDLAERARPPVVTRGQEQSDRRDLRAVRTFGEQPRIRRSERVSVDAPVPASPPDVAAADTTSLARPAADLEDLMKRVLDDAARRHGIEV